MTKTFFREGASACGKRLHPATRTSAVVSDERSEPKVVLLVRLLSAIDEGRFSFEQLKERIGDEKPPSTRSLRRYLAVLAEAGFPWYFDRASGTYRFAEGYSLRRLNLSHRELLGLVTLKRLGSSLGGTLATYIEETTAKLLQSSDQRRRLGMGAHRSRSGSASVALEPQVERNFETLQSAEREHRRVRFGYTDKTRPAIRIDASIRTASSSRTAGSIWSPSITTRSDMRVFASTTWRRASPAADVRAAGGLQPRGLRRQLGQRRLPEQAN